MRQTPCLRPIIVFPCHMTRIRNIFHHRTSDSITSSVEEACLMQGDS